MMNRQKPVFLLMALCLMSCFILPFNVFADTGIVLQKVFSRPNAEQGSTEVSVGLWLIDIDSIDSAAQNFVANVFLVLRWNDSRLAHGKKDIQRYSVFDIWSPRIEISNEIGIVRRTLPEVVDVEGDGRVTYQQRFVGSFSQPLNLRDFPFDRHVFRLHLVSVGIRADEVMFVPNKEWVDKGLMQACGIAKDISIPDWMIDTYEAKVLPYALAPGAEAGGYAFEFTAIRDGSHYIWKVILPLILIVAMSWTVFWIDPDNIGIQINIATTSMLTLIAYRFAIDLVVPRVPYAISLDEFIFGGTVLIFLSLVEVNVTSRLVHNGCNALAEKIDGYSRMLFPLLFVIVVLTLVM